MRNLTDLQVKTLNRSTMNCTAWMSIDHPTSLGTSDTRNLEHWTLRWNPSTKMASFRSMYLNLAYNQALLCSVLCNYFVVLHYRHEIPPTLTSELLLKFLFKPTQKNEAHKGPAIPWQLKVCDVFQNACNASFWHFSEYSLSHKRS